MKLQPKIICFVLSLAIFSAVLTISIFNRTMTTTLTDQIAHAGVSEAKSLSERVGEGIQSGSEKVLLKELQESQRATNADYVMILDASGQVLAHSDVTQKGALYNDPAIRELMSVDGVKQQTAPDKSVSLLVSAAVWGSINLDPSEQMLFAEPDNIGGKEQVGTVVFSLPLDNTLKVARRIVHQLAVIVGLIGLFALIASTQLVRGILKPIEALKRGTSRISQGDYGTQIPMSRKDELGQLALDFNRMSKILAETTVSKDFMSGIMEKMQDALVILDSTYRIRMINRAAFSLLRYEPNELLGQSIETIFADKKDIPKNDASASAATSELARNVEADLLTKTATRVPVLYSLSKFSDKGESIFVARDMADRKRMETTIRRSEKMSAVGQLAAGVAHEINNPLGVILGFAQALVRRLSKNDPFEMPLKSIEAEAIRCKNLVQDLLTFSRVSKVEREPVDLNKAIEASLSLVTTKAKMSKVVVAKNLANDLPRILGNSNQVQQVIINLANNALDAMGDTGTLSIKTEIVNEGPLSWVRLRVADTGSGIPGDIVSRIFEPFFTTKGVGKGTGLGLSLVHEIVKKHSGTIEVQSRPGFTEFSIKLPARLGSALQ